jgi:hypothetical protein
MTKYLLLIVLAVVVAGTGCKTKSGSREFIPGKGWKSN